MYILSRLIRCTCGRCPNLDAVNVYGNQALAHVIAGWRQYHFRPGVGLHLVPDVPHVEHVRDPFNGRPVGTWNTRGPLTLQTGKRQC